MSALRAPVAWQNRRVVDVPRAEAIEGPQQVDRDSTLVRTARGLADMRVTEKTDAQPAMPHESA
jgi:hypothetical protein